MSVGRNLSRYAITINPAYYSICFLRAIAPTLISISRETTSPPSTKAGTTRKNIPQQPLPSAAADNSVRVTIHTHDRRRRYAKVVVSINKTACSQSSTIQQSLQTTESFQQTSIKCLFTWIPLLLPLPLPPQQRYASPATTAAVTSNSLVVSRRVTSPTLPSH